MTEVGRRDSDAPYDVLMFFLQNRIRASPWGKAMWLGMVV